MTDVDDRTLAGGRERIAQGVFRLRRRIDARRLDSERQRELRIATQLRQSAGDQLAALRDTRLIARVAALGEREDGERGGGGQRNERAEGEEAKPTMPSACFGAGALHAAPCLVAGLPAQDGSGQDVVEDLPPTRLVPAEDPMSRERLDDRRDGVLRRPREGREIGHLVRDLRPRRRDEMIEEPGGDLLLLRPESVDRAFEMIRDDLARSAELVQRGNPQGRSILERARRPTSAA